MRKILFTFTICLGYLSFGQIGVSYHQTSSSFVGINYTLKDKFLAEIRTTTNVLNTNAAGEFIAAYIFTSKREDIDVYAGLGITGGSNEAMVLPLGLNIYPFENKSFGFHIELAPTYASNPGTDGLRGSWGIRYRFLRKE